MKMQLNRVSVSFVLIVAFMTSFAVGLIKRSASRHMPVDTSMLAITDDVPIPETTKVAALTFDDGPDPIYTPQILKLLSKYKARATFFVIGTQAESNTDLLKAEARGNNQVGNHGYNHIDYRRLSPDQFLTEVTKAEQVIYQATGSKPTVFRPPLGKYRNYMVSKLGMLGYKFVLWTYSTNSEDSWLNPSADTIAKKVIDGIHPGSVILLHDRGGNRQPTVDALEKILKECTANGYKFITLDAMLRLTR